MPAGVQFLAIGTLQALQHWKDKKPLETIFKQPGVPLPNVKELNNAIPPEQWEVFQGTTQRRPPWSLQHVVYLINVSTMAPFTYVNSTAGAARAVRDLKDAVNIARRVHGNPRLCAIVTLDSAPFPTQYGVKIRPAFTVVEFREFGGSADVGTAVSGSTTKLIEHTPTTGAESPRRPKRPPM